MGNFAGMGAGESDDSDCSSCSDDDDDDDDDDDSSSDDGAAAAAAAAAAATKKKGGKGRKTKAPVHRHHVKQDSSGTQLSRSSDWHG